MKYVGVPPHTPPPPASPLSKHRLPPGGRGGLRRGKKAWGKLWHSSKKEGQILVQFVSFIIHLDDLNRRQTIVQCALLPVIYCSYSYPLSPALASLSPKLLESARRKKQTTNLILLSLAPPYHRARDEEGLLLQHHFSSFPYPPPSARYRRRRWQRRRIFRTTLFILRGSDLPIPFLLSSPPLPSYWASSAVFCLSPREEEAEKEEEDAMPFSSQLMESPGRKRGGGERRKEGEISVDPPLPSGSIWCFGGVLPLPHCSFHIYSDEDGYLSGASSESRTDGGHPFPDVRGRRRSRC